MIGKYMYRYKLSFKLNNNNDDDDDDDVLTATWIDWLSDIQNFMQHGVE